MLERWPYSSGFRTFIGSPALYLFPGFGGCSVIPGRWLSPCNAAEKIYLRHLRPGVSQSLRQAAAPGPRSLLWGQTRLPRLPLAPGPVLAVPRREKRTLGLAGRQPAVHKALCLLRGTAVSPEFHQGGGRGTLPRLTGGHGGGQAVHTRPTPEGRHPSL